MYIGQNKKDMQEQKRKERELDSFYQTNKVETELSSPGRRAQEEVEHAAKPHHLKDAFLHWRAPEFEVSSRDRKWYFYVTLVLLIIVVYALFTNALIMAITFILIGMVGYIYIQKEPRILDFALMEEGIVAGREIYEFANLKSFWIFYEEHGLQVISFHTNSYLLPYIHVPIHDQDPVRMREILLGFLSEEKHEPGISEVLGRVLHL